MAPLAYVFVLAKCVNVHQIQSDLPPVQQFYGKYKIEYRRQQHGTVPVTKSTIHREYGSDAVSC